MTKGALGKFYEDGEVVVRQGDRSDLMYVVQEGSAEVVLERDGQEVILRTLGEGDFIGEMGIFSGEVRSATVRARGRARILSVDRKTFFKRLQQDPSLAVRVVEVLSERVRDLSAEVARLRSRREGGGE
jgi:CRP/FNR family cyclic AMP-dependent transcriptional regulator